MVIEQNKRVLIVDDNEQDRKAMAIVLERGGYKELAFAETAAKAMQMARSFRPGVVVVDVVLHIVDGLDVCKEIKRMDGVNPKIIMVTGHLEAVDAEKARGSGADEILVKTPEFPDLCTTVERVLG